MRLINVIALLREMVFDDCVDLLIDEALDVVEDGLVSQVGHGNILLYIYYKDSQSFLMARRFEVVAYAGELVAVLLADAERGLAVLPEMGHEVGLEVGWRLLGGVGARFGGRGGALSRGGT